MEPTPLLSLLAPFAYFLCGALTAAVFFYGRAHGLFERKSLITGAIACVCLVALAIGFLVLTGNGHRTENFG